MTPNLGRSSSSDKIANQLDFGAF